MAAGVIVCYSTCWGCKFGQHNLEPHVWWSSEDQECGNTAACKPLPEGRCGCNCEEAIEMEKEWEREAVESVRHGSVPSDGTGEVRTS